MRTSPSTTSATALRPPWVHLARAAWIISFVAGVVTYVLTLSNEHARLPSCTAPEAACAPWVVSREDIALMVSLGPAGGYADAIVSSAQLLATISMAGVGLVIFWRRSDDWVALLLSGTLMSVLVEGSYSGGSPGLGVVIRILFALGTGAFLPLPFVFPNGRVEPPWIGWIAWPLSLIMLILGAASPPESTTASTGVLWMVWLVPAAYAMIYRYHRVSTPVERQQTKWIVVGLLCAFAPVVSLIVGGLYPASEPSEARVGYLVVQGIVYLASYVLLAACIAVSILRYRLWDIDLIIRRTLVYGALTALLGAVYFGSIVILQNLGEALTGQAARSPLAVVGSTLAIAALFAPLRRRLQDFIDRRFYRRKYDAAQTLAAFGAVARDETDLDQLTGHLLAVVNETVQPDGATIWLRRLPADLRQAEGGK